MLSRWRSQPAIISPLGNIFGAGPLAVVTFFSLRENYRARCRSRALYASSPWLSFAHAASLWTTDRRFATLLLSRRLLWHHWRLPFLSLWENLSLSGLAFVCVLSPYGRTGPIWAMSGYLPRTSAALLISALGLWPLLSSIGLVAIRTRYTRCRYGFPLRPLQRSARGHLSPSKLSRVSSFVQASTIERLLLVCAFASNSPGLLGSYAGAVLLADTFLWPLAYLAAIWTRLPLLLGGLSPRICHSYRPWTRVWRSYRPRIVAARGLVFGLGSGVFLYNTGKFPAVELCSAAAPLRLWLTLWCHCCRD
jgi:hypothetical protein